MMTSAEQFRTVFLNWADRGGLPKNKRHILARVLKETLDGGLATRDNELFIETRNLVGGGDLRLAYLGSVFSISRDSTEDGLVVRTVLPEWRHGWKTICRDDAVRDAVSCFFHFASQYVARSSYAAVCGAIAVAYGMPTSFHGPLFRQTKIHVGASPGEWVKEIQPHLQGSSDRAASTTRARIFRRVVSAINALDPYVHRAIYHFVRATSLYKDNYVEEAVVALDGVVTVAIQFARERLAIQSNNRFADLQMAFSLTDMARAGFEHLYALRCRFSAHPAQSKWWDFAEIYEDDVEALFERVRRLLLVLVEAERTHKIVEAHPPLWSAWFHSNAFMLWRAVWFDGLP